MGKGEEIKVEVGARSCCLYQGEKVEVSNCSPKKGQISAAAAATRSRAVVLT